MHVDIIYYSYSQVKAHFLDALLQTLILFD
jgi:hypothetical protein